MPSIWGARKTYDYGGTFCMSVPNRYQVIPLRLARRCKVCQTGRALQTDNGVACFTFGGAWYKRSYGAGGVSYMVVPKPG
jgi:hypothetical protein